MAAVMSSKRALRKIHVADPAERAGVSKRTMERYLAGGGGLDYGKLTVIAKALGTTVTDLSDEAQHLIETDPQFMVSSDD